MQSPAVAALTEMMSRHIFTADANRRGHVVADLTALSFLIERGLATPEEVAQRMRAVQKTLPSGYQDPDVSKRIDFLAGLLSHVYGAKKPGWTPTVIEGGLSDAGEPTE